MFEIIGLDHIVLKTNKIDEMIEFYCDILGCQVEKVNADIKLTHLRIGANMIDLIETDGVLNINEHNVDHFCLQIAPFNYDQIEVYLKDKGITAEKYGRRFGAQGTGDSFYIEDPEGNMVELKEYMP